MNAVSKVLFRDLYMDVASNVTTSVVSEPFAMLGNTVVIGLDIHNASANATLAAQLEGSVLGESWKPAGTAASSLPGFWGGVTNSGDAIKLALLRLRLTISGTDAKAWLDAGVSFSAQ